MEVFRELLTEADRETLNLLVGSRWNFVGTEGFVIGNLLTCPVLLISERLKLSLELADNEVQIDGFYETLPKVQLHEFAQSVDEIANTGKVFVHGSGEVCTAVFVIRESLTKIRDGAPVAQVVSDSGVVVELETRVIAIQRRGFHGFDFAINEAASLGDLRLFPSEADWPSNLLVKYELKHELVPLN